LARLDKTKWRVVVQDESIFVYDVKIRKIWVVKGSKPVVLATGSHRRTVAFGALADDGTQLFRLKANGDKHYFLEYLKELHRKYAFMVLFIDRATYHKKSKLVKAYLRLHRKTIRVRWFPPGFPEANPLEECWRQGKGSELCSVFPESFEQFKKSVSEYYRTKRFKLNLYNYLCH
jgi:transposase